MGVKTMAEVDKRSRRQRAKDFADAKALRSAELRDRGHLPLWCSKSVECARCGLSGTLALDGTLLIIGGVGKGRCV